MTYSIVMLVAMILGGAASGGLAAASMKASAGTAILCALGGILLGLAFGAPACKFSDSMLRSKTSSAGVVVLFHLLVPFLALLAVIVGTALLVRVIL
jgi:hypothetical protein